MTSIMLNNDAEHINLPQWERINFGNICFKGTEEERKIIAAYIPSREQSLIRLYELKDRIGYEGLDLLWQLLDLNPSKRISAEQAVKHRFFDSLREAPLYQTLENKIDFSINPFISNYEGNIPLAHLPYISSMMHGSELKFKPSTNFMQN